MLKKHWAFLEFFSAWEDHKGWKKPFMPQNFWHSGKILMPETFGHFGIFVLPDNLGTT
jgi:hypothetical protein